MFLLLLLLSFYSLFFPERMEETSFRQKLLNELTQIVERPALFVSNHFFELRNEIDIKCEELIIRLSDLIRSKRAESSASSIDRVDDGKNVDDDENQKLINLYNEQREQFISRLSELEKHCLNSIKSSRHVVDYLNELKQNLRSFKLRTFDLYDLEQCVERCKFKLLANKSFIFKEPLNFNQINYENSLFGKKIVTNSQCFGHLFIVDAFLDKYSIEFIKY